MKEQEHKEDFGSDCEIDGEVLKNATQGECFIIAEHHERRRDFQEKYEAEEKEGKED